VISLGCMVRRPSRLSFISTAGARPPPGRFHPHREGTPGPSCTPRQGRPPCGGSPHPGRPARCCRAAPCGRSGARAQGPPAVRRPCPSDGALSSQAPRNSGCWRKQPSTSTRSSPGPPRWEGPSTPGAGRVEQVEASRVTRRQRRPRSDSTERGRRRGFGWRDRRDRRPRHGSGGPLEGGDGISERVHILGTASHLLCLDRGLHPNRLFGAGHGRWIVTGGTQGVGSITLEAQLRLENRV
jgi:hypothetical protein